MFYGDEETKREEERFQEQLLAARTFIAKSKEHMDTYLEFVQTVLLPLKQKEFHTEEEIEFLAQNEATFKALVEQINDARLILGKSLYRQSLHIMDTIKKQAEDGVAGAQEVYEDLKKSYLKTIEGSITKN